MAGLLVDYGSSDEDGSEDIPQKSSDTAKSSPFKSSTTNGTSKGTRSVQLIHSISDHLPDVQAPGTELPPTESLRTIELPNNPKPDAPLVGPQLGPAVGTMFLEAEDDMHEEQYAEPQSPYTSNRALLRDLTLPTVPNYDIPPSPPGSPIASTNAKFKHFLELKKQGTHFNEKLAKSAALKNPSLMQKLMDFADIDETDQYATILSKDLWDPAGFPEHAYKEKLDKSAKSVEKELSEKKARSQRDTVDFVPATISSDASRTGTSTTSSNNGKGQQSAAERIMAGLDRGRSSSPHTQGVKRKPRFES